MANICITLLSIQTEEGSFSDEQVEALRSDIEKTITYDGPTDFDCVDDDFIECSIGTRWNVPTEKLKELAQKHRVSVRAIGREDGVGFVQVVCVNDRGIVVQDDSIDYVL